MAKTVARKKDQANRPDLPDEETTAAIRKHVDALVAIVDELGHGNASDVLYRLQYAVTDPDGGIVGQKRTHIEALEAMEKIASAEPDAKKGRPSTPATANYPALVRYVEASRRDGVTDVIIAAGLVWMWTGTYGANAAASDRARSFATDDERLKPLVDADAGKFVRNVHRALGYPRTDNLTNAKIQRDNRGLKARRRRPAA